MKQMKHMERRELYEPEDIEQLLIERPYDELLEMERAFVLRHLTGRDEYEAMRALLLNVHDEAARIEPIDAEPEVRAHVLDVFRAEQQPQWRIWLNSVHAFLLPKETSAMWRPALALGSVALVVIFIANSSMDNMTTLDLAELKEVRTIDDVKNEPAPAKADEAVQPMVDAEDLLLPVNGDAALAEQAAAENTVEEMSPVAESEAPVSIAMDAPTEETATPSAEMDALDMVKTEDLQAAASQLESKAITVLPSGAVRMDTTLAMSGSTMHVVTANEFAVNFSSADVIQQQTVGSVSVQSASQFADREKAKKTESRKRAVAWTDDGGEATADASPYLGLLRAAW